jgi:DNA-binding beta-propeller fold protein YncE
MRGYARYKICLIAIILTLSAPSFAEKLKFGHGTSIYAGDQGVGLNKPEDVACGKKSGVIADTENGRLLKFPLSEDDVSESSEISIPELPYPIKVTINSKGDIFAIDGRRHRIVHINPRGEFIGYIEGVGAPSLKAMIPKSIKVDGKDTLYVLDVHAGKIQILDPGGKYEKSIAFPKGYGFISDLEVDSQGNILLLDSVKRSIYLVRQGEKKVELLTESLKGKVKFPVAITTDKKGIIYVVDENGGEILIFSRNGSLLGRKFAMGWDKGFLYYPSGACVGEDGSLFIADRENSRVQVFPREE